MNGDTTPFVLSAHYQKLKKKMMKRVRLTTDIHMHARRWCWPTLSDKLDNPYDHINHGDVNI